MLVWLRLPDVRLEEVTAAQATTVADALEVTVDTLRQLLESIGPRPIFITSDHGYIYARNNLADIPRGRKGSQEGLRQGEQGEVGRRGYRVGEAVQGFLRRRWDMCLHQGAVLVGRERSERQVHSPRGIFVG